jgi:hypothetical protein
MYGIDSEFPIQIFVGARVKDVRPLGNIFYLDFERDRAILHPTWPDDFCLGIESTWHISVEGAPRVSAQASTGDAVPYASAFRGQIVLQAEILSGRSFRLKFPSIELEVTDDSDQYESFSIPELSIYV